MRPERGRVGTGWRGGRHGWAHSLFPQAQTGDLVHLAGARWRGGGQRPDVGSIPGGIAVAEDTSGVTVTLVGDLDLAGAQKLTDRTSSLLHRDERCDMTLDLAGVEFGDSAGIAAPVALRKRCAERGWNPRTINLQPAVRRIVVDFGGLGADLNVIDE
jgi:anti-anti-sigma factor